MNKPEFNAIIVHGNGLNPENAINYTTSQRMDTALEAWEEGIAPILALSGKHSFLLKSPPPISESEAMKRYAIERLVPEEAIEKEEKSLETIGNALFTKTDLALPNDWARLVVVTSTSHLPRTLKIYQHVFGTDFDITGIPAPEIAGPREKIWELLGSAMTREVLRGTKPGDHQAVLERLFDLVPNYSNASLQRLARKSLTGYFKKH